MGVGLLSAAAAEGDTNKLAEEGDDNSCITMGLRLRTAPELGLWLPVSSDDEDDDDDEFNRKWFGRCNCGDAAPSAPAAASASAFSFSSSSVAIAVAVALIARSNLCLASISETSPEHPVLATISFIDASTDSDAVAAVLWCCTGSGLFCTCSTGSECSD